MAMYSAQSIQKSKCQWFRINFAIIYRLIKPPDLTFHESDISFIREATRESVQPES